MSYNRLTGQVPAELGKLTNLRELALSNNRLTGQVPAELGKLTNLRRLFLHENELTGTLPSSLMNLEGISSFWFDGNAGLCAPLTGVFQDWLFGNYYTPRGRGPMCEPESGGNRPPRAVGTIPTQTLTVGGPPASLSLGQFFRDPDGDQLTYSGYFTFRVTAQLSGEPAETLLITPLMSPGSASMLIIARDSEGLRAEHKINVVVLPTPPPDRAPDLVVAAWVSDSSPNAGAIFTLGATVRNEGKGPSAATTLRFYRSSDATISTSDTEIARGALRSSAVSGVHGQSALVSAPSVAGTYYYGACVDPVSGESNTGNNCSNAVSVRVGDISSGVPDLVVQSAAVNDSSLNTGESFTLSATVRNQGNAQSASTTLRYYRSLDNAISTDDTGVGTDAVGSLPASGSSDESISLTAPSVAGTYYYGACVDPVSGESNAGNNCSNAVSVRVGGTVQPPSSFDLDPANDEGRGIVFAAGRLYVVDPIDRKVYAYTVSGGRDSAADFGLALANDNAAGIVFANGRFHVVDWWDSKVYAYTASGGRDPAADFDLDPANDDGEGITFANGRFYVVDRANSNVYVYPLPVN